jgi:hypothetical protein
MENGQMIKCGVAPALILVLSACDPGNVVLLAPDKSDGGPPALTIHAVVDTPYADVATTLEWTAGIPAARVRVHRMEEPYDESYWHVAASDSNGVATFAGLLSGLYEVAVTRWLSGPEMEHGDSVLHIVAGGRRLHVSPGAEHDVTVAPDRRGSLMLSEIFPFLPSHYETGGLEYSDAKYLELYNNADTVIYLDGMYLGRGWDRTRDYSWAPCEQTAVVRNDAMGVWTEQVLRFPGAGTDYPVAPGSTVLIAKSAIDHRSVHPDLDDLSGADFEWGGGRTADNPDVPNLEDIGLRPMTFAWPTPMEEPVFLAAPTPLQALPRYREPYRGLVFVRIPRDLILDVWVGVGDMSSVTWTTSPATCLEAAHRSFERLPGPPTRTQDFDDGVSIQRRVLYVLPDGRKVLQDTDTSMEDFVKALRSPGWIPDSLGR